MADYVTTDQVSSFAHEWASLLPEGQDLLITAASRLFDKLTEVPDDFYTPTASGATFTDRDFFGDGTAYLRLDPFSALDADPITIDPLFSYAVPDYEVIGYTLVVTAKTKTLPAESASYPHRFTGWREGVKVTVSAKWGFASLPADITLSCIHLALHLWRTSDPAFAVISNANDAASRTLTLPQIAQVTIDEYRKKYSRKALFV